MLLRNANNIKSHTAPHCSHGRDNPKPYKGCRYCRPQTWRDIRRQIDDERLNSGRRKKKASHRCGSNRQRILKQSAVPPKQWGVQMHGINTKCGGLLSSGTTRSPGHATCQRGRVTSVS
jgi:hypothetical protein